jgi:hypothetical protein
MATKNRLCRECGSPSAGKLCRACFCKGRSKSLSRAKARHNYRKRKRIEKILDEES